MRNDPAVSALSQEEVEALNRHGVFFKKRVLHELSGVHGLGIVGEEVGVSYGGSRVIDILAVDRRAPPLVYFVFECKRAYVENRRWIFFKDIDQHFRVARTQGLLGNSSIFRERTLPNPPVCSEGYELNKSTTKADQDPIFRAAEQLATGFLGFIARRARELGNSDRVERYVPILVTTAELAVVQSDLSTVSIATGRLDSFPDARSWDWLILKHPFPTPQHLDADFRDKHTPPAVLAEWHQLHKESMYVVRAPMLRRFLSLEQLDELRTAKTEPPK